MIKCPSCGANLKWNPSLQKLKCDFCRTEYDAENLQREAKKAKEDTNYITEAKCFKCTSCGAELLSYDETAVTFCSYCGNQSMIESQMIKKNNPEYIIPFKKTKEECIKEYKKTINKALFVPNYMKEDIVINKFRGIYMPYAIYHFTHEGKCTNKGTKYNHRSGDYVIYDVYEVDADVDASYDGLSYDLLSKYNDRFSKSIPFDFNEARPYNSNYIAGYYADTLDVDANKYTSEANEVVNKDAKNKLRKDKRFGKYGCTSPTINLSLKDEKVGMFPVYFLGVQDKSGEYISYAVINGQTGKPAMDLPIDFKKYIIGTMILSIPLYLFLNEMVVLTPKTLLIISIIMSFISMIISNTQINKIVEQNPSIIIQPNKKTIIKEEKKKSSLRKILTTIAILILIPSIPYIIYPINKDLSSSIFSLLYPYGFLAIGLAYITIAVIKSLTPDSKNNENKMSMPQKIKKYLYKQILSIILAIIILIINFVNDIYYYGGALIIFLFIIWSFYDLVTEHNQLSKNKLPQLEKRGGDEIE